MANYYTLIVSDEQWWSIAFGSYDREEVEAEAEDYKDQGYTTRIMKTTEDQAAIDEALRVQNIRFG